MLFDFIVICDDPYESPIEVDERGAYMKEQIGAFPYLFTGFRPPNPGLGKGPELSWIARRAWDRLRERAAIFDDDSYPPSDDEIAGDDSFGLDDDGFGDEDEPDVGDCFELNS
jgi:hypothetical protein